MLNKLIYKLNFSGKYSILCTGPLTNIALAIHLYPRLLSDIRRMVILGGAYKGIKKKHSVENEKKKN